MYDDCAAAQEWLREQCADYVFDLAGVLRLKGDLSWPITAVDASNLAQALIAGRHMLPLPKEPAALANVLEVGIVDFLVERAASVTDVIVGRGTERGYPDFELSGPRFGKGFHAVDVKVARRKVNKKKPPTVTQSRISLYTGNTYFMYPELHWPGTIRPFEQYSSHLDVVCVYTLDEDDFGRVADLELLVHPTWTIASKQRSSTTREYIGAITNLDALRDGRGEFGDEEAFYKYWREYDFKIGKAVRQQLRRLLAEGRR
ncbi:restriction endonuclease [Mycolicibacterium acapulense]|nr:restriction endonuclease [Mycolicibacterium acapulense]